MARDCPEPRKMRCRNCEAEGHTMRDCQEPINMANMKCRNCDEMGHMSKDCKAPKDCELTTRRVRRPLQYRDPMLTPWQLDSESDHLLQLPAGWPLEGS